MGQFKSRDLARMKYTPIDVSAVRVGCSIQLRPSSFPDSHPLFQQRQTEENLVVIVPSGLGLLNEPLHGVMTQMFEYEGLGID